ncbi:ATP-dependent nuclease [Bradyrhizobium sp. BR 1433]|uniref:ATP-dependent nuclease n=1 Tax=Bradyrhizobium sp. BR 1433 TaxID=3447967 RepID=UPI003EE77300
MKKLEFSRADFPNQHPIDFAKAIIGGSDVGSAPLGEHGNTSHMLDLVAFRITNFRSIVDTGWCAFSKDGATVIVGQNESGKSSILEALSKTLGPSNITDDDCRIDAELPAVLLKVRVAPKELLDKLADYPEEQVLVLVKYLAHTKNILTLSYRWVQVPTAEKYECILGCEDQDLANVLESMQPQPAPEPPAPEAKQESEEEEQEDEDEEEEEEDEAEEDDGINLTVGNLAQEIYTEGPTMVLFDQASGLLPDRVDIQKKDGHWSLAGAGAIAAHNFLKIANVGLAALVEGSPRSRQTMLARANAIVTEDFSRFWSQTIGKREKLQLKCEYANHGPTSPTPGAPHLEFWIVDGLNQLFPKQRSLGVRWFVSFYLQLKASEKDADGAVFLLDEPGANLHSKAQADVLKLINQLGSSSKRQIVYTTHSPHMIEYDKLYRVLAAQRDGDADNTPTRVIHAHELGAASRDTLSPVLTSMGVDLSHQQVVQKRNNVILEEISGFYYLTAFWKLVGEKQEAYFIAATGVSNVEALANMFLGWGLEFVVAVDDDTAGRQAYNGLKRHMFGDDDSTASARMFKIPGDGIEDTFERNDFKSHVLGEPDAPVEGKNSQYVKAGARAKAILAYQFLNKVTAGEIKFADLSTDTKTSMKNVVRGIVSRLQQKPASS